MSPATKQHCQLWYASIEMRDRSLLGGILVKRPLQGFVSRLAF
ncbi:MAG: hypothetical protein AAF733_11540 [Verrucomicrobiota bacterium]